ASIACHAEHALVNGGLWSHGNDRGGHDLMDLHLSRGAILENHLARVIAFGKNTNDLGAGDDDQGADILVGHFLKRLVNGHVWGDGVDFESLPPEDELDRFIEFHGGPPDDNSDEVSGFPLPPSNVVARYVSFAPAATGAKN